MVLAFCDYPHGPLSVFKVSFNYFQYFKRYAPDKIIIVKIGKGHNSMNTGYRITGFAFCIFSDGPLSISQVSFYSLVYFQRYAPDKLFIAKKWEGKLLGKYC